MTPLAGLRGGCLGALLLLAPQPGAAQVPGIPLSAARNAHVRGFTLPTVSLESGHYRHRLGHVTPLAVRGALDRNGMTISAGYSWMLAHGESVRNGHGVGVGVAFDLWPSGKTSYWHFGGRMLGGLEFSTFGVPGGPARRQIDLPVALAFSHKLPPLAFTVLPWIAPRIQPRIVDDGAESDFRWVAGGSAGLELVKSRCEGDTDCVYGWGIRLGGEAVADVEGGPVEWGITLGLIWKFF